MSKMIVFIGLDDTDNHESRGTGRLAGTVDRRGCQRISQLGVTATSCWLTLGAYTSRNSSATVTLRGWRDRSGSFERVRADAGRFPTRQRPRFVWPLKCRRRSRVRRPPGAVRAPREARSLADAQHPPRRAGRRRMA
jgi:hypothetical protein